MCKCLGNFLVRFLVHKPQILMIWSGNKLPFQLTLPRFQRKTESTSVVEAFCWPLLKLWHSRWVGKFLQIWWPENSKKINHQEEIQVLILFCLHEDLKCQSMSLALTYFRDEIVDLLWLHRGENIARSYLWLKLFGVADSIESLGTLGQSKKYYNYLKLFNGAVGWLKYVHSVL